MRRLTHVVLRHRVAILAAWVVAVALAAVATSGLGDLLSNRFDLPGTESDAARRVLQDRFGQRNDATFLLVVRRDRGPAAAPAFRAAAVAAARRAADALPRSTVGLPAAGGRDLVVVPVTTLLEPDQAATRVDAMRRAIGTVPGGRTWLSGQVAINHDLQPVLEQDIRRGELIAVPVAIAVLLFIFGTLAAAAVPLAFALVTVPVTLGLVWILAHELDMPIYVQNLVTLIGIGIAIDYSLLVVYRFREELARLGGRTEDVGAAMARTLETAGRAIVFSGLTVATGLALLVFLPMPFIRALGVGSVLIPIVSVAAALTFLPALLSLLGPRVERLRVVPRRVLERRADPDAGMWARLARAIMRRPVPFLLAGGLVILALVLPARELSLTPGSSKGLPAGAESVQGFRLLERTLGPGALAPTDVVIDAGRDGGAFAPATTAAAARLTARLRVDPEVAQVQSPTDLLARGRTPDEVARTGAGFFTDPERRYLRIGAASRHDYGEPEAQALARRIRDIDVPAAGFGSARVLVGGGPASGIDFIDRAYSVFPYLVAAVLAVTYVLLLRAFRSLLLPLKAVILNLLSVAAAYGVLVLAFEHGWGEPFGLIQSDQVEAWIPIFLFAMLFGLSMDYEVFLLTRMRETWDETHDNALAVAVGLERTGRIVTAAALIMVAAFCGFLAGTLVGLQQFGLGLAVAVLLDATLIRAVLVPATMRLLGRWNWYLPAPVARLLRVQASPR